MEIIKPGKAGTLESNDIYVIIMPNDENTICLELESVVLKQFGDEIKNVILNTLKEHKIEAAYVKAQDRGALNCTIKARVETAILRSTT